MLSHHVSQRVFEGTLDLLLQLIKTYEVDIMDVDLRVLTQSYLDYLRIIEFSDMADVGAFIEMAATLIEIKSKKLLPSSSVQEEEDDSEDDKDFKLRLAQYSMFKDVASFLSARPRVYISKSSMFWQTLEDEYESKVLPMVENVAALVISFETVLKNLLDRNTQVFELDSKRLTLKDAMENLLALMKQSALLSFQSIMADFTSRDDMILHFIAVLELVKRGRCTISQQDELCVIWLRCVKTI